MFAQQYPNTFHDSPNGPMPAGPPYSHHFPPAHDGGNPGAFGPLPQVPPRPHHFPPTSNQPQPTGYNNTAGYPYPERHSQYSSPRSQVTWSNGRNLAVLTKLALNERVRVKITARGWVMGVVVSMLQFFNAISGTGYNVQYEIDGRAEERPFLADPDHIKPY